MATTKREESQTKALIVMNAELKRNRWDQRKAWFITILILAVAIYGLTHIDSDLASRIIVRLFK